MDFKVTFNTFLHVMVNLKITQIFNAEYFKTHFEHFHIQKTNIKLGSYLNDTPRLDVLNSKCLEKTDIEHIECSQRESFYKHVKVCVYVTQLIEERYL